MMKNQYFFFISNVMFIIGIFSDNHTFNIHFIFLLVPIFYFSLLILNFYNFKFISSLLIYILLFFIGILFVRFEKVKILKKTDINIDNSEALVIISEKTFDINNGYNNCDFIVKKVKINNKWIDVDKKTLIRVSLKNNKYIDRIKIGDCFLIINRENYGELENIDDEYLEYDSYCKHLVNNGIYYIFTTNFDNLTYIGNYNIFYNYYFYNIRDNLRDRLVKNIDSNNSKQILSNLIFGKCSLINKKLKDIYVKTNLTHILAISGLHLCLIVFILLLFLNRFIMNKKIMYSIIFIILWIYGFVISLPSSVLRSLIMFTFFVINLFLDRHCPKYSFLSNSFVFSLILNPLWIYSLGFLLSYLSTFGILFSYNFIYKLLSIGPIKAKNILQKLKLYMSKKINKCILSQISLSLSVMIFTTPILLYFFHQINLISIFSNIIIIPLFTIILFISFLVIFFSFSPLLFIYKYFLHFLDYSTFIKNNKYYFSDFIYEYLSKILNYLMIITNNIIYYISQYDFSIIKVDYFSVNFVILYYFLIFYIVYFISNYERNKEKYYHNIYGY